MTTLTIEKLKVKARLADLRGTSLGDGPGPTKFPGHVQPLIRHFKGLYVRKLLSYDCTKKQWKRHNVDAQYRFLVKYDLKLVGVDGAGHATPEATNALLGEYVRASGLGSVNAFGQKLADLFGLYALPVPIDKFKHWTPRYSFFISAYVHHHVVELRMPGQDRNDYVLLAIPFDVRFWGERTFDCKLGQPIEIDFDSIDLDLEYLDIPDAAARQSLKPRLEWELDLSKRLRKSGKHQLTEHEELLASNPEDRKLRALVERLRKSLARDDREIAELKRRIAATGE